MSAVLLLQKEKKQIGKATIAKVRFVMGRQKDCDLPLDEPLASREHAEIVQESGTFWIRDQDSQNGTFLNGKRLTERHQLENGDQIGIGTLRLKFFAGDSDISENEDDDATQAAAEDLMEQGASGKKIVEKKEKGPIRVKLRVTKGKFEGGVIRDWEGPLALGRALDNHVVLLDEPISHHHAQIEQEGADYFVVDLGSSNGTFIDKLKVRPRQRERLRSGQEINLGGGATLVFEMTDRRKQKRNLLITTSSILGVLLLASLIKLLQPPDIAGKNIADARALIAKGSLVKAKERFEAALKLEPRREEALKGLNSVKNELEARRLLVSAETNALAGNYDIASETVKRVFNIIPKHRQATELEKIIELAKGAELAITGRNWEGAVRALKKAGEAYPNARVIASRLKTAQRESAAKETVAQAREYLRHKQEELAQGTLTNVAPESVYFAEAKELLQSLSEGRNTREFLAKAQASYHEGKLAEAAAEIEAGLKNTPNHAELIALRERLAAMTKLESRLGSAEALQDTDAIENLLSGLKLCETALETESDPRNVIRKRAQESRDKLRGFLQDRARAYLDEADSARAGGNRKEALKKYELALLADATNPRAGEGSKGVRNEIVAESAKAFRLGLIAEDNLLRERAREAYQKVLEIGVPDDSYYKRAAEKLGRK